MIMYWVNERAVPSELLELLNIPEVPNVLRAEIIRANDEVERQGAVNYPTKARIEYYIHKYQDLLETISESNAKKG